MEVRIESLLEGRLGAVIYVFIVVFDNKFWEGLDDTAGEVKAARHLALNSGIVKETHEWLANIPAFLSARI